jgi:hypothetical protein
LEFYDVFVFVSVFFLPSVVASYCVHAFGFYILYVDFSVLIRFKFSHDIVAY